MLNQSQEHCITEKQIVLTRRLVPTCSLHNAESQGGGCKQVRATTSTNTSITSNIFNSNTFNSWTAKTKRAATATATTTTTTPKRTQRTVVALQVPFDRAMDSCDSLLWPQRHWFLGGGFKDFLFSPLGGEMIQFDSYFSNGLKPPTRFAFCAGMVEPRWVSEDGGALNWRCQLSVFFA